MKSEPSRWNCEECRKQGLESRRRCGFLAEEKRGPRRLVWARGSVGIEECPRSYCSAESAELVERFFVSRISGARDWGELRAREADAFQVLEEEWRSTAADIGAANGESGNKR